MGNSFAIKKLGEYTIIGIIPIKNKSLIIPTGFEESPIKNYMSLIDNHQAVGWVESDIDDEKHLRLTDISHIIEEIKILDKGIQVKAKILLTPKGKILKNLIDAKINSCFSILSWKQNQITSINITFNNLNPIVNNSI